MNKNEWSDLFDKVYPKKIEFENNKHLFTKLAFDVFRLNSSPVESLWELQECEDGKQYLVATYSEEGPKEIVGDWNALTNKEASIVVLYYKDFPLHKFAATDFGFNKSDAHVFKQMIVNLANSDQAFLTEAFQAANPLARAILSSVICRYCTIAAL